MSDRTPSPDPSAPGKPRMSAWQRWEMNSVYAAEEAAAKAAEAARISDQNKQQQNQQEMQKMQPAILIDDAELQRLRDHARRSGEEQGYTEGHDKGWQAGYAAGAILAEAEAQRFSEMLQALPKALKHVDRQIADDLITLAFDIARKVVQKTVAVHSEQILNVVHDLLQTEPALSGTPRLLLNEEDMSVVRKYFNEDLQARGWLLRSDPSITRGGCRVQASNGELDGTVESRFARVAAALARHDVFDVDNNHVF
jgi:flagellar assembly protein FliH